MPGAAGERRTELPLVLEEEHEHRRLRGSRNNLDGVEAVFRGVPAGKPERRHEKSGWVRVLQRTAVARHDPARRQSKRHSRYWVSDASQMHQQEQAVSALPGNYV